MEKFTRIFSLNDHIACKPLTKAAPSQTQGHSVMNLMSQTENLQSLEVLFGDSKADYNAGDLVYLRKDAYDAPFTRMICHIDNKPFILVPKNMIILKEAAATIKYTSMTNPTINLTYEGP